MSTFATVAFYYSLFYPAGRVWFSKISPKKLKRHNHSTLRSRPGTSWFLLVPDKLFRDFQATRSRKFCFGTDYFDKKCCLAESSGASENPECSWRACAIFAAEPFTFAVWSSERGTSPKSHRFEEIDGCDWSQIRWQAKSFQARGRCLKLISVRLLAASKIRKTHRKIRLAVTMDVNDLGKIDRELGLSGKVS